MTIHLGNVPAGTTLYIPFATYNAAGASVTMTGFATGDIFVYKNGGTTARTNNGYALLDTDGTDFNSKTGIHGFSIDLSNTGDATTTFSVGAFYWVVISSITADSQTVNFIAATFRIVAAESVAGYPKTDSQYVTGVAPETAAVIAAAVETELGTGSTLTALATQASVNTIDDFLDTEIATLITNTTGLATAASLTTVGTNVSSILTAVDTEVAAIKTKTDFLPSVTAGSAGGVAIVGSAMTLSTAERTAIADAHFDLTNGIETGLTPRQLGRLQFAAASGKTNGMGTSTANLRNLADTKNRIQATVDASGNRSAVTLDLT